MAVDNSNSDDEFISDELLSGYLDDELSSDERDRVERALESNERQRQVLAELRKLRKGLGALPVNHVDAGFQQRVMERISNGEVLGGDAATIGTNSKHRGSSGTWRRYLMSVAAIAAGVTIMLFVNWNPNARIADSGMEANPSVPQETTSNLSDTVDVEGVESDAAESVSRALPSSAALAETQDAGPDESASLSDQPKVAENESTVSRQRSLATVPANAAEGAPVRRYAVQLRPDRLAKIVRAVRQQDRVDLVVSVRANDPEALLGVSSRVSNAPLDFDEKFAAFRENAQPFVVEVTVAELRSLSTDLESAGGQVATLNPSALLAKASDPAVNYFYRLADVAPNPQRDLRSQSSQDQLRQTELFIDLDAGSPQGSNESNSIEFAATDFQPDESSKKLRVLFVMLPPENVPAESD